MWVNIEQYLTPMQVIQLFMKEFLECKENAELCNKFCRLPNLPYSEEKPVLLIRICFKADPDPAFFLSADPDQVPGCQNNADPFGS